MPVEEEKLVPEKEPEVLDLFTHIDKVQKSTGVRAFFWGEWKTGKTYSALSFPEPIYVLDTEGGAAPLAQHFKGKEIYIYNCAEPFTETPKFASGKEDDKPFAIDPVRSLKKVEDATLALLKVDKGTIVVDSVSDVWEWIQSWLKYNAAKSVSKSSGKEYMMQTEWQHANAMYRVIIDRLKSRPCNLILTSRAAAVYQDGQVTQMTKAKAQANTQYWFDIIVKFAKQPMPIGTSGKMEMQRVATIESSRYGDPTEPVIKDLTYEKLKTAFTGLAPAGVFQ